MLPLKYKIWGGAHGLLLSLFFSLSYFVYKIFIIENNFISVTGANIAAFLDFGVWFYIFMYCIKGNFINNEEKITEDLLERDSLIHKIKKYIIEEKGINTGCGIIPIFGENGFGKTFLLHQLEKELIKENFSVTWFNPSEYSCHKMRDAFYSTLSGALTQRMILPGISFVSKNFSERMSTLEEKGSFYGVICKQVRSILLGDTGASVKDILGFYSEITRYAIFIDDIDRCNSDQRDLLIHILRNLGENHGGVIILATTPDELLSSSSCITTKEKGLERLFKANFYIPPIPKNTWNKVFDHFQEKIGNQWISSKDIRATRGYDPRSSLDSLRLIKIITNKLLIENNPKNSSWLNKADFLAMVTLSVKSPSLHSYIYKNSRIFTYPQSDYYGIDNHSIDQIIRRVEEDGLTLSNENKDAIRFIFSEEERKGDGRFVSSVHLAQYFYGNVAIK